VSIAAKPRHPARHDHEYERNGTTNLFMMFAPLESCRHVKCPDRHAAADYAQMLKDLSDTHLPTAKKIILVQTPTSRRHSVRGLAISLAELRFGRLQAVACDTRAGRMRRKSLVRAGKVLRILELAMPRCMRSMTC
jgi:hypothetical protein